ARVFMAGSFSESVEAVALVLVAGPADVGDLDPAGAGAVELVLRAALHEEQRAGVGPDDVEGTRADAAMVVERRGLRHVERLLRDAAGAGGDPGAQLQRDRAVALLVVGPGHEE